LFNLIRTYLRVAREHEEGQGLTEYAMILSVILVGVAGLLVAVNGNIQAGLQAALDAM
jgi:Flp pilus assembly pilin Flp